VLLSLAGLTLDTANFYWQERRIQIAADAAALAGATELALNNGTSAVSAAIQSVAVANGADNVTWNYSLLQLGTQVQTSRTFDTYFAGILGISTFTVHAMSETQVASASVMGNLLPMTTMCDDMDVDLDPAFTYGATYTLWDSNPSAPGNVGWLDWNGGSNGASELAANIANPGNSGTWEIGDWVPSAPGVKNSSAVRQAMDSWIGQVVTIPLYDLVDGNGSNTMYHICAFAAFQLTDYNFHGSNKWVEGTFVRTLRRGGLTSGNAPDFGVRTVRFVY